MIRHYPCIDLHARAALVGVDLDAAMRALNAIYADVDARNAANTRDLDLPCHRGCDMCCHESVFITPLEFYTVWHWVQTHLTAAERSDVVARGLALYDAHRDLMEALQRPPPEGHVDHTAIAVQLHFRCPLLSDAGACRVYPVRELFARLFGCSFNDDGGLYGCHLVGKHLGGKVVTLLPVRGTAKRLRNLPLTDSRNVYPYYLHSLYGVSADPAGMPV